MPFHNLVDSGSGKIVKNAQENTEQLNNSIKDLNQNIIKLNESTEKYSEKMIILTIILFALGLFQFITMLFFNNISKNMQGIVGLIILLSFVFFVFWIKKKNSPINKN